MLQETERLKGNHSVVGYKRYFYAFLTAIMVFVSCYIPPPSDAFAQSTTITLSPTPASIQGCESIEVEIWINDVTDLYAADVRLSFDPSVLEVVDQNVGKAGVQIADGTFLDADWHGFSEHADNTNGTIQYAITQFNPDLPVSGSGVLAIITFRAKSTGTSDLQFTYKKLSDRNGGTIAETSTDGSVSTSSPDSPVLSITKDNDTDVTLGWSSITDAVEYSLYRDTTPYFTPTDPPLDTLSSTNYPDTNVLGDVNTNYYYVVKAVCPSGFESPVSNRVGEFDFDLLETTGSDYVWIALTVNISGLDMASDLANHIEANSDGTVTVQTISRWNATAQSSSLYYHQFGFGDFLISNQMPFRVEVDVANGTSVVWTQVGGVPAAGSYSYTLQETTGTDYSWIMLPLDHNGISMASDLSNDIEANASAGVTVQTISQWNGTAQSFSFYYHQFGFGDFSVWLGYPYRVEVDVASGSSVTWP